MHSGLLLISANLGSYPSLNYDQRTSLFRTIIQTIEKNAPDFVAIHLQEISGKKFQPLPRCTEDLMKSILETAHEKGFKSALLALDDSPDITTHTSLGGLYLANKGIDAYAYCFEGHKFIPLCESKQFIHGLDNCSLVKQHKFEQKGSNGRKGLLQTRWRIGNRCLDFVNIHLHNDNNNLIAVKNFPHDRSAARGDILRQELTSLQETPFIIFGDFNFRLNQPKLLEALFHRYVETKADALIECVSSDTEIVYQDASTNSRLLTVQRKHIDLGALKPLLPPLLDQARRFDEEPGAFEGDLFEYPIGFRPSYPFSEEPSKPSDYASSHFPAWCDRVFISRLALNNLNIQDATYGLLCEDLSVGDHKPVFLQLTLTDDALTTHQEQRNVDKPELVTTDDSTVSQEQLGECHLRD